jgi:HK97 family phage portal protein
MVSLLTRGNVYGWIERLGSDLWPSQIVTLHPDEIQATRKSYSGPVEWSRDGKTVERWPAGPLWHVPAYLAPGNPIGMSPIRYAAETIGLGLATQRFGAQWFGDGAHPTSVITSPHEINETQAKIIKARVIAATRGNREPLALGADSKLTAVQVAPEESQFLETIKANADDVARFFFRRPPGEGGSITYANVEARSLDLLSYTLNGWMVRVEKAMSRLRPRPRFVKINADALVRVDLTSRYKAHDLAIRGGWKSRNDVRRIEDEAPITDGTGDEYLWPPYSTTLPGDEPDEPEPFGVPVSNGNGDAVPRSTVR